MSRIRKIKVFKPKSHNGQQVLYLMGYKGRLWQSSRQLKLLVKEGYSVLALDYKDVFKSKDPQDFIELTSEIDDFVINKGMVNDSTIIVGVSLGGLIGYNLIRRHTELNKLIIITGGNLARVPAALHQKWPLSYDEIFEAWKSVNMHSLVGSLSGKHVVMVLPKRDKIIDPNEVIEEVNRHGNLNNIKLVKTPGGHFRTIITQTILRPKKVLKYLNELK